MREKIIIGLIAVGVLLLASFFRIYGFNWDQNQHLHPDERFLTMVANAISWPENLYGYLDTETSPLNPHNRGFGFFVYGTFPIIFTKWVAELFKKGDYVNLTLVGRQLSALFDIGTVMLVFLIARLVKLDKFGKFPLLAMFFYASMVLPIQLSHFFAVDTYITFFITLTFYFLIKIINSKHETRNSKQIQNRVSGFGFRIYAIPMGIAFGLALASKISAILFLPIILIGLTVYSIRYRIWTRQLILGLIFIISAYFTFRISQPYLFANPDIFDFTLNEKVLDNWKQLKSFNDPTGSFPPAVQWIKTKPYLFPLKNIVLWGLGLPLGIIALLAIGYRLWVVGYGLIKKKFNLQLNLILLWILLLFFYQGSQFVKALRYFYPIYPFIAILSGYFISILMSSRPIPTLGRGERRDLCEQKIPRQARNDNVVKFAYLLICLFVIIYPFSFISIYSRPNSRVAASEWIYKNIPAGSYLSGEHWDDFLPLSLPKPGMIHEKYNSVEFPLYNPDTKEKWKIMEEKLNQTDYIILTSNRLYGSLTTVAEKFPITFNYYKKLFDGSLGFTKIAEFTSRPNLSVPFIKLCLTPPLAHYGIIAKKSQECNLPGISLVDDYADETFTVYDHPKVIIFKKEKTTDYLKVLEVSDSK